MLDTKKRIALAVAAQVIVIIATLWLYGAVEGAEQATRNTARTAAIFFAWALALRSRPAEGPGAMFGFVAAHAMHFMSVIYFSVVSVRAPLHVINEKSIISITAGSALLTALALTINSQGKWLRWLNAFAASLFGFVFVFATIFNGLGLRHAPAWGSVVPLPFLVMAIVMHLRGRKPQLARAAAAS